MKKKNPSIISHCQGRSNPDKMSTHKNAFTLVEIMVGILIVSIVIIGGFQALSAITIGKAKLIQKVDIQKESFYFTEKLFEMVKQGGTLDYEEYFNRSVIGNTTYSSGHFAIASGFGNFGKDGNVGTNTFGEITYACVSESADTMTGTGCVTKYNSGTISTNYTGEDQRYGQYALQFIDYNSNADGDGGDEDGDGDIIGDDDDEFLGDGPEVFASGASMPELYLISGDRKTRTYFRWSVKQDPYAGSGSTCTFDTNNNITGSGCIGTVEYIRLLGKDWGVDHDLGNNDNTQNDGLVDTWVIDPEINGVSVANPTVAGSGAVNWVPLFSDTINVSEFKIYSFPNKDLSLAWRNADKSINVSPYTIIKIKLKPSWITKRKIGGDGEELDFSMTINLSDIYSN